MRSSLEKFWTLLFVALVQLPVAGVVSGLVGPQNGLPFWFMGIAAHLQVRSVTNLSLRRRLAIWLAAMTAGGITAGFIAIAIGLLTLALPTPAVSLSMQALFTLFAADSALSIPSWTGVFVVAVLAAISFAPVIVAWGVSRVFVRRSSGQRQVALPSVATRRGTQGLRVQSESDQLQKKPSMKRGWRLALSALAVVAAVLVGAFFGASFVEYRYRQVRETQASTANPFDEILRRDKQAREPVAVLSIDALLAEYRENEFAAAAKYENAGPLRIQCLISDLLDGCRVVETSGTIREMGRDDSGVAYIRLATANEFASVEARFDDPGRPFSLAEQESLQTLRRGQRVSVRCMVLHDTTRFGDSVDAVRRCSVNVAPRRPVLRGPFPGIARKRRRPLTDRIVLYYSSCRWRRSESPRFASTMNCSTGCRKSKNATESPCRSKFAGRCERGSNRKASS